MRGWLASTSPRRPSRSSGASASSPSRRALRVVFPRRVSRAGRLPPPSRRPDAARARGELLELFGLGEVRRQRLFELSKGTKQKMVIAAALLHQPDVLFLDEPLDGLDANAAVLVKELLKQLAAQGRTILFCSHILDVVERICSRIVIIDRGRKIAEGSAAELTRQTGPDAGARLQRAHRRRRSRRNNHRLPGGPREGLVLVGLLTLVPARASFSSSASIQCSGARWCWPHSSRPAGVRPGARGGTARTPGARGLRRHAVRAGGDGRRGRRCSSASDARPLPRPRRCSSCCWRSSSPRACSSSTSRSCSRRPTTASSPSSR